VLIESSSGNVKAWQSNKVPVNGLMLNSGLDASTTSSELRFVSKDKGPLRWIAGAMVLHADSAEDVRLDAVAPPPAVPVLGPIYSPLRNDVPKYDSKSRAVFGGVSFELLGGTLTPLLGLRYFRDERTFTDNQRAHTLLPAGAPQTSPPLPPPGPCTPPSVVTSIGPLPPGVLEGGLDQRLHRFQRGDVAALELTQRFAPRQPQAAVDRGKDSAAPPARKSSLAISATTERADRGPDIHVAGRALGIACSGGRG